MNKHPIDELFRDKLANHSIAPKADAWERMLEKKKGQSKKNPFTFRMMAAACISMLFVAGAAWVNINSNTEKVTSFGHSNKLNFQSLIVSDLRGLESTIVITSVPEKNKAIATTNSNATIQKETTEQNNDLIAPQGFSMTELETEKAGIEALTKEIEPISIKTQELVAEHYKIEIAFKPGIDPERDDAKNNKSAERKGVQARISSLAREVKNPNLSLSDLREAKNELLAFNFLFNPDKNEDYVPE